MATSNWQRALRGLAALPLLTLIPGCFATGDGVSPPLDAVNYPVGLALSSDADRLYVANSDFDLRYNGGTVLALDAVAVRELLPTWCRTDSECAGSRACEGANGSLQGVCVDKQGSSCGELGEKPIGERGFVPGRCKPVELRGSELVVGAAKTAPFSTDIRYVTFENDAGERKARLLLPVRGDASLHWVDVEGSKGKSGELDCGQTNSADGVSCDEEHRIGNQEGEEAPSGSKLPPEPATIGVSSDGRTAVIGHQTLGRLALFSNGDRGPRLQEIFEGVGYSPMSIAALPPPNSEEEGHLADFLVTYLLSPTADPRPYVELVRAWEGPTNAYLQRGGKAYLTASQTGYDSRGITVDSTLRDTCLQSCDCPDGEECDECTAACATTPMSVFVASRSPDSLVVGTIAEKLATGAEGRLPDFQSTVPLRGGPSRLASGDVINELGEAEGRVFVLSFDTGTMTVYDPAAGEVESRVTVGRGPQGVAIDSIHGLAYVAIFTDSYISVVDIDRRHSTYGQVLLNLGMPTPPVSSK